MALDDQPLHDAARLARLYNLHFGAVLACCRRMLRNPDDAADAAQEVFLKAIESVLPERTESELRGWLLAVARNHCVDLLRQRSRLDRFVRRGDAALDKGVDPERTMITRQTVAAVMRPLRLRERQALWQSAVEGQSPAGIASALGLSYMAAAQLLHRARRHAMMVAAKVAAILYLLQRRLRAAQHVSFGRVVALGSASLLAATISTSTPPQRPAPLPAVARTTAPPTTAPDRQNGSASGNVAPATIVGGVGSLDTGALPLGAPRVAAGALWQAAQRIKACLPAPGGTVNGLAVQATVVGSVACVTAPGH